MKYEQKIVLKNSKEALIRNGNASDGLAVYEVFNLTHAETDYLLSYPDENSFNPEQEARFLEEKAESSNEAELIAITQALLRERLFYCSKAQKCKRLLIFSGMCSSVIM